MVLKVDIYDIEGKTSGQMSLPFGIFGEKLNKKLVSQAVRVYLANQRSAKAKVKNRGEVSGSGVKIWRQKGTGRARHGDRYAPIFIGGGVAHGPTGKENYSLKMSKVMKRKALFSVLSDKFKNKSVIIADGLEKIGPKTKSFLAFLKTPGFWEKKNRLKILLVLDKDGGNLGKAARNIEGVDVIRVETINIYQAINHEKIIFTKDSLAALEKLFIKKE